MVKGSYLQKKPAVKQIYNNLYSYSPACHLRIVQKSSQYIAIVTQVFDPTNIGMTITIGAEALATQIVEEFNLDPEKTLFVEHWPETGTGDMWDEEKWDIVEFTWQKQIFWQKKKYASDPKWSRIQPQQLLKLLTS